MSNEQNTQAGANFLTNDQIAAGAAIECDHGAPIGRNVAIDVFDAMRAAAPVAAQAGQVAVPEDLQQLVDFLMGEAELEGVKFGDRHPNKAGAFWWRLNLRAAVRKLAGAR